MTGPLKTGRLPQRECSHCKKLFSPKRTDTRFCSQECISENKKVRRRALNAEKLTPRKCEVCKTEFSPVRSNHVCCSPACNDQRQKLRQSSELQAKLSAETRLCKNATCSITFSPSRSNQVFCSAACADRQGKRDWKARNSDKVKASESQRLKRKYRTDPAYRESRKQKSNERFHALSPSEKTERSRRNRAQRDPEALKAYHREYFQSRSEEDLNFRLINLLRSRTAAAIKTGKGIKSRKTEDLLGCAIAEARDHLESLFDEGMSWENWGLDGWHLDHIRPCISFDMSDENEQYVCFNWRNLSPLWGSENLSKNDRYEPEDEIAWAAWMRELGYEGDLYLRFSGPS